MESDIGDLRTYALILSSRSPEYVVKVVDIVLILTGITIMIHVRRGLWSWFREPV